MASFSKYLIIIAGPTASGKSDIAYQLAKEYNTQIISSDSRQCYREMSIGTAKPHESILKEIKHYFINSHSITENINAADFEHLALGYCTEIFSKNDLAILCGGTGLYIDALCYGLDIMPEVDEQIKQLIEHNYEKYGLSWLQEELKKTDPSFYETAEIKNPARLIRALSFHRSTGESINDYKKGIHKKRNFKVIKICLDLPKDLLYTRINKRVDIMMKDGLINEVTKLYPFRNMKNLQTVGYKEFYDEGIDFPPKDLALENVVNRIKQHTRNYAKRQITWFKKDQNYKSFNPGNLEDIKEYISNKLTS